MIYAKNIMKKEVQKFHKKKMSLKKKTIKSKNEIRDFLSYAYTTGYKNWATRGSTYFNEIKRVGIKFIDEILKINLNEEKLSEFSNSPSSTMDESAESPDSVNDIEEFPLQERTEEFINELWLYLCYLVKNTETLVEFSYEIENEKWIEVTRTFNRFKINEECLPDITLKVVYTQKNNNNNALVYYFKCLERMIKTGPITCKGDILYIIKVFSKNKYVCLGIDKEKFITEVDENERLRNYLKENAQVSINPFESLWHNQCKAVVKDSFDLEYYRFRRGKTYVCGPLVMCKLCETLLEKLLSLLHSPSTSLGSHNEGCEEPGYKRYGPVQSLNICKRVKRLCTETVYEFIKEAEKDSKNIKKLGIKTEVTSESDDTVSVDESDQGLSEDERPTICVSENEFQSMVSMEKYSDSSRKVYKKCNKCGYEAQTMLALFNHMGNHITPAEKESSTCDIKFISKIELTDNKEPNHSMEDSVCSICQQKFVNNEDFYYHMNSHRPSKPFICAYCDQRVQSLEAYKHHMRVLHNLLNITDMNFMCNNCHTYYFTQDHLLIHCLNSNHIEKTKLKCKICNVLCNSISAYQDHVLSHTYDEREYHNLAFCIDCKIFFFSSFELEDHVEKSHGRESDFIAEIHLERNLNISRKDKGYSCEKCLKTFPAHAALKKHIEMFHLKKSEVVSIHVPAKETYLISCNMCEMKFASEYSLNVHMNLHNSTYQGQKLSRDQIDYLYLNRAESSEPILQPIKHGSKQLQDSELQHHPQPIIANYNQIFSAQQQSSYQSEQISSHDSQPQIVQLTRQGSEWNQHVSNTTADSSTDSVYNLLHL